MISTHKSTIIQTLLGLIFISLTLWGITQSGMDTSQDVLAQNSPLLPETSSACVSKKKQCITFELLDQITDSDGLTTFTVRITNDCDETVSRVEIMSQSWQQVAPADQATYSGFVGDHTVEWKDVRRIGFHFTPQADTWTKGNSEVFSLQVQDVDEKQPIRFAVAVDRKLIRTNIQPWHMDCRQGNGGNDDSDDDDGDCDDGNNGNGNGNNGNGNGNNGNGNGNNGNNGNGNNGNGNSGNNGNGNGNNGNGNNGNGNNGNGNGNNGNSGNNGNGNNGDCDDNNDGGGDSSSTPPDAPNTACLTATDNGFTFDLLGHADNGDGTTTIWYRVTKTGQHDVSYVAFGVPDGWTSVGPGDGSTYAGKLGDYNVVWTNDRGNPGFPSIKFETNFEGFGDGTSDVFAVVVSGFDASTTVQVAGKAGQIRGVAGFDLGEADCGTTIPPVLISDEESEQITRESFANTYQVSLDSIQMGSITSVSYPLTNQYIQLIKLWSPEHEDNSIELIAIDRATGEVIDYQVLKQAESDAYDAQYGKLHPMLYEHLQVSADDDIIPIAFWLNVDIDTGRREVISRYPDANLIGFQPSKQTDLALYEQIYTEMVVADKLAYDTAATAIVDELTQEGFTITGPLRSAPILSGNLPKYKILELTERGVIDTLYLDYEVGEPAMDIKNPTLRTTTNWNLGYRGASAQDYMGNPFPITVGIVEAGFVDFDHFALNSGRYANPLTVTINYTDPWHATFMAGIVASIVPTVPGVAPEAFIYSANSGTFMTTDLIFATEKALAADVDILNNSYGNVPFNTSILNLLPRYLDHVADAHFRTETASAGNNPDEFLKAPSIAYNVISVGGMDNHGTAYWGDDTIWNDGDHGSSYMEQELFLREKPEVVAIASEMLYVRSWWDNLNWEDPSSVTRGIDTYLVGTSGATAQVSGLATLLMDRDIGLTRQPQAVKAIIMASAVHNVDIHPLEDNIAFYDFEKDGVGAINGALADRIVQNEWYTTGTADHYSRNLPLDVAIGERVRVVLTWHSHTGSNDDFDPDRLESDLDLSIQDNKGNIIRSTSRVNNYEMIEFTAKTSGPYTISVETYSTRLEDINSEIFGLAWSRMATYLPDIRVDKQTDVGWNSSLYIRNDDAEPESITISLLNPDGSLAVDPPITQRIPSNGLWEFVPYEDIRVPDDWQGSAIVDGNEDISVVVIQQLKNPTTTIESYAGVAEPSAEVYVPIFQQGNGNIYSDLFIQNAGTNDTGLVTFTFSPAPEIPRNPSHDSFECIIDNIEPGGSQRIHNTSCKLDTISDFYFVGSVYIRNQNQQPLAVASTQFTGQRDTTTQMMETSNSQPPSTVVYAPLLQNKNGDWVSGLSLQSVTNRSFDLNYYKSDSNGNLCGSDERDENPAIIPPSSFETLKADVCVEDVLHATTESPETKMVANVNQVIPESLSTVYAAISNPSYTAIVPVIRKRADGHGCWDDGFVIQNPNDNEVNLEIKFYNEDGSIRSDDTRSYFMPPRESIILYGSVPKFGNGILVSAVVMADSPVAVAVNNFTRCGNGLSDDTIGSYPAIHRGHAYHKNLADYQE